jgi:hypothetical protein
MDGRFSGTIEAGTGSKDTTGVFGAADTDLSGASVTGTFTYDTSDFTQSGGDPNTLTSTGPGALTVTITIGGQSHTFTDQTSGSVALSSSISDATYRTQDDAGGVETFYLDVNDLLSPFLASTDPATGYSVTTPDSSSVGIFSIDDIGPVAAADGRFSVNSVTVTRAPEPASLGLLAVGLGGLAAGRRRRRSVV